MKPLKSYNIDLLDTYAKSLSQIELQINDLIEIVNECDNPLSTEHRDQFIRNIQWIKQFYESAERNIIHDNK